MNRYTNERNIQMLIALIKERGIKRIIVNPGTMNMSFVASIQNDDYFETYSCVDERSACYMACGMAAETQEPVVLTCTGATASRNYMPGMTEAFYRKLPILAVTCTPHLGNIGHNVPQMIDRRKELNDTYMYSTYIQPIKQPDDEWYDNVEINKALIMLRDKKCGPVHINLGTELTKVFNVNELPAFRTINKYGYTDKLPEIKNYNKIGIFIGNHSQINDRLEKSIDEFCEKYNSVVICDHTSNYKGKYGVLLNILCDQEQYRSENCNFDLLIHLGNISGAYMQITPDEVWRVNPDGEIRDTFKKLKNVFEMEEDYFFKKYNEMSNKRSNLSFYKNLNSEICELRKLAKEKDLPFSNIYTASKLVEKIPPNSVIHLAILNTLRSWNYFADKSEHDYYCNTGGFGIDGMMSTMIGASLVNKNKIFYGIVGDLAFFYDLNSLGNRHIGNNLRILLVNNGCGTEFHNYSHPANVIGQNEVSRCIAADGHFGNKSRELVKNYAENLGFEYISARNKEEFDAQLGHFCSKEKLEKPIIFEIFTDSKEESDALYQIRNLKTSMSGTIKKGLKKALSQVTKNKIRKFIRK